MHEEVKETDQQDKQEDTVNDLPKLGFWFIIEFDGGLFVGRKFRRKTRVTALDGRNAGMGQTSFVRKPIPNLINRF